MMCRPVPLILVALTTALAAPASMYEEYPVAVPQKRAALVLDRLLIALQKALHDSSPRYDRPVIDGPRTAALRISEDDMTGDHIAGGGERGDEWLGPQELRVLPLHLPTHEFSDMACNAVANLAARPAFAGECFGAISTLLHAFNIRSNTYCS